MQQERLRALGRMASGIAHDINNALTPATLYAQSLLDHDKTLNAEARNDLGVIQQAIDDVTQTVARIKEFYRGRESNVRRHAGGYQTSVGAGRGAHPGPLGAICRRRGESWST